MDPATLGGVAETDDVLQDTWLAWASRAGNEVASPRAYLVTVAVHQAMDRH